MTPLLCATASRNSSTLGGDSRTLRRFSFGPQAAVSADSFVAGFSEPAPAPLLLEPRENDEIGEEMMISRYDDRPSDSGRSWCRRVGWE